MQRLLVIIHYAFYKANRTAPRLWQFFGGGFYV